MPASHACLMILVAAAGGWAFASILIFFLFRPHLPRKFLGITLWGVLPAMQNRFAKEVANSFATRYLQPAGIASHLNNEALLQKIRPEIEKHVDVFLEQKLPETFPLLAKLMGEKTLAKFKAAFLAEVEAIFPALVTSYAGKILEELQPALLIETELKAVSVPLLQDIFRKRATKQLLLFKILAAIAGAMIAVMQWLVLSFAL